MGKRERLRLREIESETIREEAAHQMEYQEKEPRECIFYWLKRGRDLRKTQVNIATLWGILLCVY